MGLGSWARFIIGIILSGEIIRAVLAGDGITGAMVMLSVLFLVLAAGWFVKKLWFGL